jgi:GGDEF domain-containing protein
MDRAGSLAREHGLRSVIVGLSGFEGDVAFQEVVDYLESALRVDDSVFRMTRERVVLLLTDVDAPQATAILERLLAEYCERFPRLTEPAVGFGTFEVGPDTGEVSVKRILPTLFTAPQAH